MRSFSSCTKNSLGLLANSFWAPLILAMSLFFLLKIFPKTSTFYFLAFLVKLVIASERAWSWSQLFLTNLGNFGCISHIVWNLKGLFEHMGGGLSSSSRTRQCSVKTRGRWVTDASGKAILQDGFPKQRSILSKIKSVTCLRFNHVNFGPEKPKSSRLHKSRHSLNSRALLILNLSNLWTDELVHSMDLV